MRVIRTPILRQRRTFAHCSPGGAHPVVRSCSARGMAGRQHDATGRAARSGRQRTTLQAGFRTSALRFRTWAKCAPVRRGPLRFGPALPHFRSGKTRGASANRAPGGPSRPDPARWGGGSESLGSMCAGPATWPEFCAREFSGEGGYRAGHRGRLGLAAWPEWGPNGGADATLAGFSRRVRRGVRWQGHESGGILGGTPRGRQARNPHGCWVSWLHSDSSSPANPFRCARRRGP